MASTEAQGAIYPSTATFTDSAGDAADPTAVTFQMRAPGVAIGDETEYVYGTDAEVVKDSTGVYHVNVTLTTAGLWVFAWTGTGTVAVPGWSTIWVRPQPVEYP